MVITRSIISQGYQLSSNDYNSDYFGIIRNNKDVERYNLFGVSFVEFIIYIFLITGCLMTLWAIINVLETDMQ